MMKNAFHFILNALFVLKIFKFLSCLFGHVEKRLDEKKKSQPGQQTLAIHTLSNIFRSKSNQTMKLGQLIDNNKGNVLLQKSCRK